MDLLQRKEKREIGERVKRVIFLQNSNNLKGLRLSRYERICLEFYKSIGGNIDFMWEDEWLKENFNLIEKLSHSDKLIFLIGESGVGKEVLSRLIHYLSKRRGKAFNPLNCSGINEETLYSEIFGHEKGSFTSAYEKREGILKTSDGGTVFLDEIQASSKKLQYALLRFLDYREIRALGSDKIERSDVRVIVASCEEPDKLVKEGKLIEPFYHRISGIPLRIPPLRERKNIESYIYYFLYKEDEEIKITDSALEALKKYPWSGNFREMKKVIEYIVVIAKGREIKKEMLPEKIKNHEKSSFMKKALEEDIQSKSFSQQDLKLENVIKKHIQKVLKLTNGNKTKASELLGIPRTTLLNKLRRIKLK